MGVIVDAEEFSLWLSPHLLGSTAVASARSCDRR
jgi:hypothetical protein